MITTSTGAKKIEGTDNWRLIFDAHNDTVTAYDSALSTQSEAIAKKAYSIHLLSTDTTWAKIWAKLNTIPNGETATIMIANDAYAVLSGGAYNTGTPKGVCARSGANTFNFILHKGSLALIAGNLQNANSSSSGTYLEKSYYREDSIPVFKYLSASSGNNDFNVGNNSRIAIDFFASGNSRCGSAVINCSNNGTVTFSQTSMSNLTITAGTNKITVNSNGGSAEMYCRIYAGDITT